MAVVDILKDIGKGAETVGRVAGAVAEPLAKRTAEVVSGEAPEIDADKRARAEKLEKGDLTMKRILSLALMGTALSFGASAQTITLKGAASPGLAVALTWDAGLASGTQIGCDPTTYICVYDVYRIGGVCPQTLIGSTGWTLVATTADSALDYTDGTVGPLTTYSYVVEAVLVSDSQNSNPSNCITVTTPALPLVPAPPTQLAL